LEQVILVDPQDHAIGAREKVEAHVRGELHRAFSIFVLNAEGQLLMQRRAEAKYHTAGLWSNTCDGHPRPGETVLQAAQRRLAEEMGVSCPLVERAAFPYRAELGKGLTEHEIDHLLIGRYDGDPTPDPAEASEWKWMDLQAVAEDVEAHPEHYVPWLGIALTYASYDAIMAWARALADARVLEDEQALEDERGIDRETQ
jgi:isopentenyl-diphosphate delta-isomerase